MAALPSRIRAAPVQVKLSGANPNTRSAPYFLRVRQHMRRLMLARIGPRIPRVIGRATVWRLPACPAWQIRYGAEHRRSFPVSRYSLPGHSRRCRRVPPIARSRSCRPGSAAPISTGPCRRTGPLHRRAAHGLLEIHAERFSAENGDVGLEGFHGRIEVRRIWRHDQDVVEALILRKTCLVRGPIQFCRAADCVEEILQVRLVVWIVQVGTEIARNGPPADGSKRRRML